MKKNSASAFKSAALSVAASLSVFASACFTSALFTSCTSDDIVPEVYEPFDYTEESAVEEEIKRISDLDEKNESVKALWRSYLLKEKCPSNLMAQEKYSQLEDKVLSGLSEALKANDAVEALRLYTSLESCESKKAEEMNVSRKVLEENVQSAIPSLADSNEKNPGMKKLISGTVTVFVDKGIKIENGVGHADAVLGSGFFITENGYIITNHHVIEDVVDPKYEGTAKLYIKLADDSDTRIPAVVAGYDSLMDLALLKAEIESPYVFSLGSSNDLNVGDRVYAIGSPLGLERTLTSGIISSTDRTLFTIGKVFQLDAAVNSGNSGGPLIDENGRVQAIVFAGVSNYQGLNFAIPVEYLRYELPYLFKGGEVQHSWTGAYGKTKKLPGFGKESEGVSVMYTMPGSSSNLSGMTEGETIVSFDRKKIDSLDQLHNLMLSTSVKTIVEIQTVDEDEQLKTYKVYLDVRPENPGYDIYCHDLTSHAMKPVLGMELKPSSSTNKNQYVVSSVLKGSVADESGFSEDDEVQILKVTFSEENAYMYAELYAKKRKSGYLDAGIGLTASMDSPYYF